MRREAQREAQPRGGHEEGLGLSPPALGIVANPGARVHSSMEQHRAETEQKTAPIFGMASGKAAWLQGKDLEEGMRMDTDLRNGLRNISLCSLTTLNNRNHCLGR